MAPLALVLLLLAARRGAAQIFSETSASAVVEELKALHERGTCPDEVLDGVGLTEVADREGGGADGGQHRRAQKFGGTCNPATFAAEAQRVDEACCDADTSCDGGLPAHCDAKCAIVYNDFFGQCQGQLDRFGMADGYEQLFATCSNLPTGALLRAAVQCSGLNIYPTTCTECRAGQAPNDDRTACVACAAGRFSSFGVQCQVCTAPRVVQESRTQCNACPAGQGPNDDHTDCVRCTGATFSTIGVCQDCVAPNIVEDSFQTCRACGAG
eukprot:SAG31_NODE_2924_length_4905_cov_58.193300_4_plen_268_part_01